jgi:RNA polymerase sigma-70 factor (ECF subfamily)
MIKRKDIEFLLQYPGFSIAGCCVRDHLGLDEPVLLKNAQKGDTEAFGVIYERYALRVFRYLYAHISDRMDAEDLTEETFLRAWRSLRDYNQRGAPFFAFLIRIARNALIDHYRNKPQPEGDLSGMENYLRDPLPEPGEQALVNSIHGELRMHLGQLRDEYREVLVARFLLGLTPEETAKIMGKSQGAIRVLQHRALASLKTQIEAEKSNSMLPVEMEESFSLQNGVGIPARKAVLGDPRI